MVSMSVFAVLAGAGVATAIPSVTLGEDVYCKNVVMPLVGLGTWQYNDTVAYEAVCKAFAAGYTFVDTANGYGNQRGVGQAIKDCWKRPRGELFVMTKIPGGLNTSETWAAHRDNLHQLQLTYVDHLMTHFPGDWAATPERSSPARRQEEWKALESIWRYGEARSIGVSHYCTNHIDDILEIATVRPTINQVEYHVGSGDIDSVIQKCADEKIHFMSFSTLCGPCTYKPEDSLINGALVSKIGAAHGVSGAQVSLRWVVQQALTRPYMAGVIPKSNSAKHIASNIDVFGFELSDDEMMALSAAAAPPGSTGDCNVAASVVVA